ncbi:alpha-amylase family glycosyl hydrolase [Alteromonas sp. a30]|uniref:alpha-amylase family glycosyl hydrolase n=1 Tax=Alteromonas sp. a30 TaxID=2730917 RepID=UPI0022825D4C|nr:alpha-amylase family glycosyl hydrolase [Alteromonas sp. a30]
MKMNWLIPVVSMLFSGVSHAEWFFRGTSSDWQAVQLDYVSGTQFQTCQSFAQGDGGGPRFKVDRFGDWSESYPSADVVVSADTSYVISFNVDTKAVTTTQVSSCGEVSGFPSLNFRGTANAWGNTAMTRVSASLWQTQVYFDGQAEQRFKFDILGDWSQNYGDNNADNILEFSGDDIRTSVVGDYVVEVNEDTLSYSLTPVFGNLAPSAAITPGSQTVVLGAQILFDASGSSDPDGSIASYSWSNGSSQSSASYNFNTLGSQTVSVTVTDDQGATNTASVTISVEAQQQADSWYFRGTANGWSSTLMTTSDNLNYCTQQTFAGGDAGGGPRFKIDHYADWTESYPSTDYSVNSNTTYDICFNATTKAISVTIVDGVDLTAPSVSANPAAGNYASSQSITLSVSDNQDASPILYFTTDGSTPTTASTQYTGQTIAAQDVGAGVDLSIKTLSIDADGNQQEQSFVYYIGETTSVDFREETIYFLLTARFYDGDSNNNYYNRDRIKIGDPHWRGDFKGLIEKLDYIKDLGFTAIWITPPVENRSGLDYHGYHAYDFYKVDPRLESPDASYQDLINAAHAKGLKIIQDVVINHSGQYGIRDQVWIDHLPIKYYVPAGAEQGEISNDPYFGNLGDYLSANRDDNDNSVAPQWFKDRHNSDPEGIVPLVDPKTGETVPKAGFDPNRFFGIDAQGLDPNWYHLDGFMAGGDWENPIPLQNKHLAGDTIDLATERQNVKDYLNGAIRKYLDMGVDAIRVDTVKHIERDELLEYVNNWKAHKPGLFVFGENLVKGSGLGSELANDNASAVIRPWWYTRTTQDPSNPNGGGDSGFSVLDFSVFSTFRDNVTRGSFGGVGGMLGWDWIYGDATQLVTFFQNHDVGPDNDFKYRYGGEEANAAMVYNLLWTNRGIPTLYYGEEIMFKAGAPQDIASANDTIDQTGRAYFGPHLDDLATTQSHPLYQHIKRLNQIRKAIPALQKAPTSKVNEWGAGMSFVRDYSVGGSYAVVGLASGGAQSITVSGVLNGTYRDVVTGNSVTVTNGSLSFNVKGYSAGIYVLNGPGKIGSDGVYLR